MEKKITIAIVENEIEDAKVLEKHIKNFFLENKEDYVLDVFLNGFDFLEKKEQYSLIFLDIEMPGINGMDLAKKLRNENIDNQIIIFVTNMAQFAIQGYKVNALDFCLKPVSYHDVYISLTKALDVLEHNKDEVLVVKTKAGTYRLSTKNIVTISMVQHDVTIFYYDNNGDEQKLSYRGALKEIEKELQGTELIRANSGTYVNKDMVESYNPTDNICKLTNGMTCSVSRSHKKGFIEEVTR